MKNNSDNTMKSSKSTGILKSISEIKLKEI